MEHTDPSDLENDPENQAKARPSKMTLNSDQQVPSITKTYDGLQGSPSKSSPSDSEDGIKDIRESCEKEAELVQEKAQPKDYDSSDTGTVIPANASNVDVAAVRRQDDGHNQSGYQRDDQCSTSSSNVNPASR